MTESRLLDEVAEPSALRAAWQRVHAKGAAGGSDGMSVEQFASNPEAQLLRLERELREGRYVPDPLLEISIPKGDGRKGRRMLRLPTVRDKVVQGSVRDGLEVRFERTFLDCSYGYRPRKGPQRAVRRVTHYLKHVGLQWAAKADIDDFFDTVDHARLVQVVEPLVADTAIMDLIRVWLQMGSITRSGRWRDTHGGIAQGSVLSPLLANAYLHQFDLHEVSKGEALVRYADDFVILSREQRHAEQALEDATAFLKERLGLRINQEPDPIAHVDIGFSFLGIRFAGTERLLAPAKRESIDRQLTALAVVTSSANIDAAVLAHNRAVEGWRRYYGQLLAAEEIAFLADRVRLSQAQLLHNARKSGLLRTAGATKAAATRLIPLQVLSGPALSRYATALVRGANGQPVALQEPPGSSGWAARSGTAQAIAPSRSDSPGLRVQRRKRRHFREAADASELVVVTPGSFVGKSGERIVVRCERRTVVDVPVTRLRTVTLATHGVSISSDAIVCCVARGVPIILVSPIERIEALVHSPQRASGEGGVLQVEAIAEGPRAGELAASFAGGKVANQLRLMKSLHKYRGPKDPPFADAFAAYAEDATRLVRELRTLRWSGSLEEQRARIMGLEGRAAAGFWHMIQLWLGIRARFESREHRGSRDPMNMLFNYGYAVLQSRVHLAVVRAGMLPEVGFLHAAQAGRPSLVLDLMEEFRPHVVDRAVLTLISRRRPLGTENDGLLDRGTRSILIQQIHRRLATLVKHRELELTLEEVIRTQARAVVRHLRGETRYRPFVASW